MDYKIIKTEEEFLAEKDKWTKICNEMKDSSPFQTWDWNYLWWKNNELADSLFVIKAFTENDIYGYAPIIIKNNTAEFIGGKDIDYGAFIVVYKIYDVIEGFINVLLKEKVSLSFQEMSSFSDQLHIVERILETHKNYIKHRTTRNPYIELIKYSSYDDYSQQISGNMRSKIKKWLKPIQSGEITFSKEKASPQLFEDIKTIYTSRQEVRGGSPDISWSFKVIEGLNRLEMADIYLIRKDITPLAYSVFFKYKNVRYQWITAISRQGEKYYPGQLLNYFAIVESFSTASRKIDFMRGDYDFKMRWGCSVSTNYSIFLFSRRYKYFKQRLYFAIKPRIKKLVYNSSFLIKVYKKYA